MTRVVRFHEYGDPQVLRIEELPEPQPGPDEVRIRVKAIGLNRAESMFRRGQYLEQADFPSRLGYEAAGLVEAVGEGVRDLRIGDAVSLVPPSSIAQWGTYAEQAVVPAAMLVRHPDNLDMQQAAGVWMQYLTAWGALVAVAGVGAGDHVLITAASSSVGLAAIQIANRLGAIPIAVTRGEDKVRKLLAAGAVQVIVSDQEDLVARVAQITSGNGVRVVFDPVGGPAIARLAEATARGGIIIEYGALSNEPSPFPLFTVLGKSLTLRGYLLHEVVNDPQLFRQGKAFVTSGLEDGSLAPVIARTFPFEEIVQAHEYLEAGEQFGKIIVTLEDRP
ncbi:zinc-dependent alcohol dehydrogenase family protein [Pseudomonas sp. GD04058]|uniref:zinc-dependent alcohol dehydrogenase family protein n=1 Tax=Pseudomonas sp. GD04058 TaxID=2975429 RepID=UPI0024481009|nr:zinc-dependent alcohol dehydrogenase family protein [Pseudomonas sp. GD04058]MDG9884295.1 zinc-dependent alcohol dehydrogenase family protein [Pseudomonas sp. GD04058]